MTKELYVIVYNDDSTIMEEIYTNLEAAKEEAEELAEWGIGVFKVCKLNSIREYYGKYEEA